jgi:RNA polymerase sigma-70 factor (ECF subfamily)
MKDDLTAMWNRDASLPAAPEYVQEDAWVISSQRGDALAFNRLVLKWESRVYNLALRMLQHPDEAAEATQEVFLSAYKSIRRFRRNAKFSTWLYRIALNHCISRARRRPQGAHFSLDDGLAGATQADRLRAPDSQEGELLRAENRQRVRSAMAFLPPEQRAVVELKFFQEMTFDDIAAVLEVPLSTIKSRLYAALDSLRVRLGARA